MAKSRQLTNEEVQHRCLCRIEDLLQGNGKSLKSFSAIPYPIGHAPEHIGNKLIHEELDYNKETLQMDFNSYYSSLTRGLSPNLHSCNPTNSRVNNQVSSIKRETIGGDKSRTKNLNSLE
ncbi:hypothetical protein JHK86_018726 [Glycine max]|nr:hypothetical protein JHK86_018726 [Glycine max]